MTPRDKDQLRKQLGIPPKRTTPIPDIPDQTDEDDAADDQQGSGRVGAKPLLAVTFRFINGDSKSFQYSHLYSVDFDRSGTITLTFSGHSVKLTGRNLDALATRLEDHKRRFVQEVDPMHAAAMGEGECEVTGIVVGELREK